VLKVMKDGVKNVEMRDGLFGLWTVESAPTFSRTERDNLSQDNDGGSARSAR